ncbi:fasciclin domain-containing protein [Pedobacter sp. MC2016-24]|uniref:fasciclin domain-containing protein n=1 Tax=Pedobacter sp. MC2016-24 TaxID=2780090 RepID=UPI0018823B69|nr:fasciclin domain-containing protein [Pedobacter sp. MC2016-24]MBE9600878.1 fasciclin domain-containing protein [Pedobacter sp. MC2016-24]
MKRKKTFHIFFLLILTGLLASVASCKHNELTVAKENENFRPAADFVKNNYDLSLFAAAINKSGLSAELNAAGSFTLLVPDDAAFNAIGIKRAADFDRMNPDSLKHMVRRHVLTQRLFFQDIPTNGVDVRYRTLAGTEVYCSLASYSKGNSAYPVNELYFNGSLVNRKDITLSNGALHVLNRVMKSSPGNTIQDFLVQNSKYSIFVSGLKRFGLWNQLAQAGPFTVYAPENQEFEKAGLTAAMISELDPSLYHAQRLFGAYILKNKHLFVSDFRVLSVINESESIFKIPLEGDSWYISVNSTKSFPGNVFSYDIAITTAKDYPYEQVSNVSSNLQSGIDIVAENGLIHDLQGILVLPAQALKQN